MNRGWALRFRAARETLARPRANETRRLTKLVAGLYSISK